MTPDGALTVLHQFAGGNADGAYPRAALIRGSDGNFYGTTYVGGALNYGTAFTMTPAGTVTLLHSFSLHDGGYPQAALVEGVGGEFYGTSPGAFTVSGEVFKITPSGAVSVLYRSQGGLPVPHGPLIEVADGKLVGMSTWYSQLRRSAEARAR